MLFSEAVERLPGGTEPGGLGERVRVLRDAASDDAGEFVLYWMHHAARADENPALETAIALGAELGKPVLVYQGLGGRHRFNSDRHHVFIMEGARDVAAGLAERGVRHVFHLPADPSARSPLRELARRSACVVVEEFPAPPFPKWVDGLLGSMDRPVFSVDASCIVPMRLIEGLQDRAFKFKKAAGKKYKQRVGRRVPTAEVGAGAWFDGDVGFEPVEWEGFDIGAAAAGCWIDHSLPAIEELPGGSSAGYARWDAYKGEGLGRYHKTRNNAAIHGVSRMSPYLHHGMVWAGRLAREAEEVGGDGAEKFVDELFAWRELAHHFCYWKVVEEGVDLESLDVLPDWARSTLVSHADDEREYLLSWEDLARGCSGDRLWDAAQGSLVRRGELHNNLRMTWAKAIVGWTRGPRDALEKLIDLNHRFALDGNDPNSYGGLLWGLGVLDRPFEPERPVFGTVRVRDTGTHAERLDLDTYEEKVGPVGWARGSRVAVVGAGMAGAVCARELLDQDVEVVAFDKGRGPGGRASTHRDGDWVFDHGAQYFSAKSGKLRRHVRSWVEDGVVAEWGARFGEASGGGIEAVEKPGRFVGVPGMNRVVEHVLRDVEVRFGTRVVGMERGGDGRWSLGFEGGGGEDGFDAVVVALPSVQAAELLSAGGVDGLAAEAGAVQMDPCWAVMVGLDEPVEFGFDAVRVREDHAVGGVLGWAAADDRKPGRGGDGRRWVLHAAAGWSREHLEDEAGDVVGPVLEAFCGLVGREVEPVFSKARRWRFARRRDGSHRSETGATGGGRGGSHRSETGATGGHGALVDGERGVVVCGDWVLGGGVEKAVLSGDAGAGGVMGILKRRSDGAT